MRLNRRAILASAPAIALATTAKAQDTGASRDYYRGQASVLIQMAVTGTQDFERMAGEYSGSDESKLDMIALVRSWKVIATQAHAIEPPSDLAETHDNLTASLDHFAKAGAAIEESVQTGDSSHLDTATRELADAATYMALVEADLDLPLSTPTAAKP
jgi:hypothetical protein